MSYLTHNHICIISSDEIVDTITKTLENFVTAFMERYLNLMKKRVTEEVRIDVYIFLSTSAVDVFNGFFVEGYWRQ